MPGVHALKCLECGIVAEYRDLKYIGGTLVLPHKMSCSQQYAAYPKVIAVLQATNPSVQVDIA